MAVLPLPLREGVGGGDPGYDNMSGTNKDNTRAEEFKRATAGVLRAIAELPDVQVAFQPGPSGAVRQARPPAAADARAAAGRDGPAARLSRTQSRCVCATTTTRVHAARMPARREAKDAYDALEQARVEVVGSRHMAGVAANLRAKLCRGMRGRRLRPHDAQGPVADRRPRWPCWRASACPARPSPPAARAHSGHVARHAGRDGRCGAGRNEPHAGRPVGLSRGPRGSCSPRSILRKPRVDAEPEDNTEEGEDGGEQSGQQDDSAGRRGAERVRSGQHARRQPRGDGRRSGGRRGHRIGRGRRGRRGRRQARRTAAAARAAEPGQRGGLSCLHPSTRRGDRGRGTVRPR